VTVDENDNNVPLRFVNTHMETKSPVFPENEAINFDQTKESLDLLFSIPKESGLILACELNSIPCSRSYKLFSGVLPTLGMLSKMKMGL